MYSPGLGETALNKRGKPLVLEGWTHSQRRERKQDKCCGEEGSRAEDRVQSEQLGVGGSIDILHQAGGSLQDDIRAAIGSQCEHLGRGTHQCKGPGVGTRLRI